MGYEVEKVDSFVRLKANPGAVISINKDELNSYKAQRRARAQAQAETQMKFEEINTLKQDVESIKTQMSNIENMLVQLLEKNK